jgi:anti-sigma factor RsiW
MIDPASPVTHDELHAYIDGELPVDRHEAVAAWLATHPDDAALVEQWRAQAEAIRARYGAVVNEPVPRRFDIEQLMLTPRRSWRSIAAAAALALVVGSVGGWIAHDATAAAPSPADLITGEALTAHRLYVGEARHPIEVRAAEQHLMPWLSRRVGTTLRAPDLAAFDLRLLGGRLLPGPIGPAALFMYEGPTGERYTFYCSRTTAPETTLRYNAVNDVAAVRWVETQFGYVVSGPANRDRMLKIAETAYEQMDRAARPRAAADQLMSRRGS